MDLDANQLTDLARRDNEAATIRLIELFYERIYAFLRRLWDERVSPGPLPDETASQSDLAKHLYARIDQLEPDLRDSIHLHYYQELSLQETADAMDVAASTVKYRLRQALDILQKHFSEEQKQSGWPAGLKRV